VTRPAGFSCIESWLTNPAQKWTWTDKFCQLKQKSMVGLFLLAGSLSALRSKKPLPSIEQVIPAKAGIHTSSNILKEWY
jgi:hypothetical protein